MFALCLFLFFLIDSYKFLLSQVSKERKLMLTFIEMRRNPVSIIYSSPEKCNLKTMEEN